MPKAAAILGIRGVRFRHFEFGCLARGLEARCSAVGRGLPVVPRHSGSSGFFEGFPGCKTPKPPEIGHQSKQEAAPSAYWGGWKTHQKLSCLLIQGCEPVSPKWTLQPLTLSQPDNA